MTHPNSERGGVDSTASGGCTAEASADPVADLGRAYLSIHIALAVMCIITAIAAF